MGTQTGSVTLHPSGYEDNTNVTLSNISRAYNSTSNSSAASISISQSKTGYLFFTFDTSSIPAGATITSITGSVKVRVSSTTRVTDTKCQLFTGDTAKGNNVTFASTSQSNVVTLSPGNSWSRSDLNNLRLKIGGTASSSSSSRTIYVYGANITVNYSVQTYDITIQNSTGATVTASESEVASGGSVEIFTDTLSGITVTDNSVDVTSQFVQATGDTVAAVPGSYQTGGSINGTNYQSTIGKGSDTSNRTGNDYFSTTQGGSGSTWIDYYFDFSAIPLEATIQSVTLTVKGHCESTSESREISRVQAYSGSTAKGSSKNLTDSTTDRVYTVDVGTWTAAELHAAKLRHTIGVYGGLVSGATWTVVYELSGYVYTISSVASDHVIVVTPSGGGNPTIYYKANGSWVAATAVYKKVNGSWVLQTNLANVFDDNTNYVKG